MTDPAVAIAYVHDHEVSSCWHHSIIELLAHDLGGHGYVFRGGWVAIRYGTDGLVEGRNMAVRTFLDSKQAEWLWWTDTDMGFEGDVIDRLMEAADPAERPVVGALCFSQREHGSDGRGGWRTSAVPTIYDWGAVGEQTGFAVRWDYERDRLNRCAGTGSACVLIHRSVFERVGERFGAWYDRVPNHSTGQLVSEDLSFCMRLGALDIPVHVHAGVRASHHKAVWLDEEDYIRERVVEAELARRQQGNGEGAVREARAAALARLSR